MSEYNGWSNRSTWLINVWFNPETPDDVDMAESVFQETYDTLPDFMRDFVDTDINWDELRESVGSDV